MDKSVTPPSVKTWGAVHVQTVDTRKRGYSFLYSVLQATEPGGENGRASYRESLNLPTYQPERTSVKTNVMMECAYLLLEQQL